MPAAKQPSKQSKRQHRPRIDAVLRHIENGSYDEEIGQILAAVETRRASRQEAVLKMVKETYGEDFVVTNSFSAKIERGTVESAEKRNPFLDGAPSQTDEWIEAERRAREQEEALAHGDDYSDDDISNSPVIGSIDVSATPTEDQGT